MGKFGLGRSRETAVLPFFGHQVIEYFASLYVLQVGAQVGGRAAAPCYVLGALMLAAATFSGKPLGGGRLSRSAHRLVDVALIAALAATPYLFGFDNQASALVRLEGMAVALALLAWFTNYGPPQPGQVKDMARDFRGVAPRLAGRAVGRRAAAKRRPPN
jgi:hypothetical protein